MEISKRLYDSLLDDHLDSTRQMAFISGPRQVGKTTTCRAHSGMYLNWDDIDDREQVMGLTGGWQWSLSQRTRLTTTAGVDYRKFDEDDDIYRIRLELERDINRTLQARLSAGRLDREFEDSANDYDINGGALYVTATFGRE